MSVVIKSRQVKFRNTNSENYQGVSAISEEKTTDMIQQIEAAGAAEKAAIIKQGEDTYATIPEEYSALTQEVSDLKADLSEVNEYGAINLQNFVEGRYNPGAFTLIYSGNNVDITGSPTGSGYTHSSMYNNASAFPNGLSAGQIVQFTNNCEDNNVHFRFFEYVDGTEMLRVDIAGTGTVQHKISDNATGCIIRYSFVNGHTYDHVKSTYNIFTTLTKQQIENFMEENAELFDLPDQISSIATFEENSFKLLTALGLTDNYYWSNGGLNSVTSDSAGYYRAASTLVPVNAGDHLILKDFYLYSHDGGALIGMYDNDGHNAPGRVNCNSPYVKTITVQDNIIKFVDIEIPEGCTQVGLFIKSPNGVTECVSSYRISNYDYTFDFTDIAEEQIKEIAIETVNGMTIEAQDIVSDYYIKGEAPKLERTKKLCIIGAGQSNIDGRVPASELPSYITLPMSGMYYEKNSLAGQFTNNYPAVSEWSFDLIMAYHIIQTIGADNFYYIKWSQGGTSIDKTGDGQAHWTADYEGLTENNALLLEFNKEILKSIKENPDTFEIGAMIWHQGEGDRGTYSTIAAANYYTNMKKVIAFCRGITQNDCLPFILGTVSENSSQYDSTVDNAIRTIAREDPYVYLIDMKNAVLRDSFHFNDEWSIYMGEKVFDALIDAKVITGTKINPSEPT